jgi:hypothetical protein
MDNVSAATPHDASVFACVPFKCKVAAPNAIARMYNNFTPAAVLSGQLYRVPSRPGLRHLPGSGP